MKKGPCKICLVKPNQNSEIMMNIFGAQKLDKIHLERMKVLIDDKFPKFTKKSDNIQTNISLSFYIKLSRSHEVDL
jgi:ferredoxin-fold anticodon binding domain-containing protein